ncbi:hypothetical protein [Curtobacterium sp. Arg-1]|uniref:hypothetical protein n=1 Tax=Curtobacterium sp. Arg-1 TaxID=2935040 RepID=UPI0021D94996|nr:hypothetical protein [Curtobacterium sp. Arg-1]UXZ57052.1 hypothetical protein MXD64_13740 [Curtobacterium sp. Arg-1]
MYNATATINAAIAALRDAKTRASDAQQGRLDAKLAILNADLIDRQQGLVQPNTRTNGLVIAEQVAKAAA